MIENRRRVKAVVADTVIDHTDIRRKIVAAGTAFGTVKEQGFSYIRKASALESPVGDGEMFFLGIHIIDILRIIYAVDEFQQASKLTGLQYDIPHISAVADPGKFSCESVATAIIPFIPSPPASHCNRRARSSRVS